jgi:hypothetical protein
VISRRFSGFVRTLCTALRRRDARTIVDSLPHYQYNSGLRYGYLGDGEGQTGDPSLLGTWLAKNQVRCVYFTPDVAGHGLLLTRGWPLPSGNWSLIEMDTFNGRWKINDFTFGRFPRLFQAMHLAHPILRYG